jgi:hypothetical protein
MNIIGLIKNIVVDAKAVSTNKNGIVANVVLPDGENAVVWVNQTTLQTLFPNLLLQVKNKVSSALLTLAAKGNSLAVEYRQATLADDENYDEATSVKQAHYSAVLKGADPIDTSLLSLAIDLLEGKLMTMPPDKRDTVSIVSIVKEHADTVKMYAEMYGITAGDLVTMISTLLTGHYNSKATTVVLGKKAATDTATTTDSTLITDINAAKAAANGDVALTAALNNLLTGLRSGTLTEADATTQFEQIVVDASAAGVDLTASVI